MRLLALILMMAANVPDCHLANEAVESLIADQTQKLRGEEYCQFRKYDTLDDVDGDDKEDFIVLFTVEGIGGGGNDHIDFMAVFSSKGGNPMTVETGRRGERDPINISVEQGQIVLETLEYLENDAACCPSGHGKLTYRINSNRLEKVH